MHTRVFSSTYPTWALVGGLQGQPAKLYLYFILSFNIQCRYEKFHSKLTSTYWLQYAVCTAGGGHMATINYRSWLLQVRIDAYKYTTQIRRPKAQKVENIGAWLGILKVITFTAVVLNVRPTKYLSISIYPVNFCQLELETNIREVSHSRRRICENFVDLRFQH